MAVVQKRSLTSSMWLPSAYTYVTTASFHVLSNSSFIYHPFIRRYLVEGLKRRR
jgi:hypothetical protein